jgi:hypothetical protein
MTRSLARGDYSLLMAVESASRPDSWYRVLTDRRTGALSCDCPPWTFNHDQRTCTHSELGARLVGTGGNRPGDRAAAPSAVSPLITATQQQWPGLQGVWSIEERTAPIKDNPFRFVLLRLDLGNGGTAMGTVAFAERHHHSQAYIEARVAGWAGYAIAAEVARLGGFPLAGQPPEHFRVDRRPATGRRTRLTAQPMPVIPRIGLADILRVGDHSDQGDGLRPEQRAENTLHLFLGETLYQQLETQHFLDVPSVHYAAAQRVYRLRRDPAKAHERRVRVFERGQYSKDFCIVRGQDVPEADWWLGLFLGLMSDEQSTLSVVGRHNVFSPFSDGEERETVPPVWVTPR